MNEIIQLTDELTNQYIKQGNITSKTFLIDQVIRDNILTINGMEGKIEGIDIENSSSLLVKMTFPNIIGNVLNLRDLEQGLEQLNYSGNNKYTIDIQPGKKEGYSHIFVKKQAIHNPISLQFNLDNTGSTNIGDTVFTVTSNVDSLLGLGENWSTTLSTNSNINSSKYSRYITNQITIPYGYWSYKYQFFYNQSRQSFNSIDNEYVYKNQNTQHLFNISHLIFRNENQRLIIDGGIKYKSANTQLASQTLDISSPTLTAFSLSSKYSSMIGNGYLTLNLNIDLGISAFGNTPDYITDNSPRSHYRKFSMASSFQKYITNDVYYLTSFYGH